MTTHSSILAWKICGLRSLAVHGVPKSRTRLSDFTFTFILAGLCLCVHSLGITEVMSSSVDGFLI